jgi:tetratricopeptide (TPR) repeat protein
MSSRFLILGTLLAVLVPTAIASAIAEEGGASAALSGGTTALSGGKYESAVKQLSAALNGDKISPGEAAKAFYLRGIAYQKLGQSARAIADLGAAIWLGLPASDRVKAQVNRGLAFRAAGLNSQAEAEIASARKDDQGGEVDRLLADGGGPASSTASIAAFATELRADGQGVTASTSRVSAADARANAEPMPSFGSTVMGGQASPPPRAGAPAPQPTRTADASAQRTTPTANSEEQPSARQTAAPTPSAWSTSVSQSGNQAQLEPTVTSDAAADTSSGGGNRLTRWWGSLKSSAGSQSAPPPSEGSEKAPEAGSGWTTQTHGSVVAGNTGAPPSGNGNAETRMAAATPAAPALSASGGSYRVQLAASRSEDEARQLWQKVVSQNQELAGKEPSIDKTEVGGLGTFYRLQIGPFQDKAESLKLCNTLKRSGVDCFLVTR